MRNFTPNIQFKSILDRYGKESAYTFYRKTNYWLNLSNRRFAEDKWKCVKCSCSPNLQNKDIHLQAYHTNYSRYPWREKLEDIISYCNKCYQEQVKLDKESKNKQRSIKLKRSGTPKNRDKLKDKFNNLFY